MKLELDFSARYPVANCVTLTMTLLDDGWTAEQAKGLLDSLKLDGGIPEWETNYLQKLRDWCATHDEDWTTIEGQLEFVAYELLSFIRKHRGGS